MAANNLFIVVSAMSEDTKKIFSTREELMYILTTFSHFRPKRKTCKLKGILLTNPSLNSRTFDI